jgi:hypothetical protein
MVGASVSAARETGVALDSEYVIFSIDTSGSMRRYEWDRVLELVEATLDAHAPVAGFQVLNDEGRSLLLSYTGEWMPDTPQVRQQALATLADWDAFSNSSPRNGIHSAIEQYGDPARNIALYVLGDDLPSGAGTVDAIVREIDARNRDATGNLLVRINAVAFPVWHDATGAPGTGGDFANLMLAVTQRNGGSFVALTSRGKRSGLREPLTSLTTGGNRTLIAVDASGLLAGTRWNRVVDIVGEVAASLEPSSEMQIVALGSEPAVVTGSGVSGWIPVGDANAAADALAALRRLQPSGETSLDIASTVINDQTLAPDNVILLVSGLPTVGAMGTSAATEPERVQLFQRAAREFSDQIPVNVLLLPNAAEPVVASAYWSLVLQTGGALVAPASNWP